MLTGSFINLDRLAIMIITRKSLFSTMLLCTALLSLSACKEKAAEKAAEPAPVAAAKPVEAVIVAVPLPPEMMVAGQPIDPLCFQAKMEDSAENALQNVSLTACRGDEIVLDQGATLIPDAKGFISYRYGYNGGGGADTRIDSFAGYYYLGQKDGLMVVLSIMNGGGSGTFTNIATYRRTGDTMSMVKSYAAGDRCNGGIAGAKIVNGVLTYGVNLTPMDILAETGMKSQYQFNLSEDVESSASSCFGVGAYEDGVLAGIVLSSTAALAPPTGSNKYQPCYNAMQRDYIKQGMQTLIGRDFTRFSHAFQGRCIRR